MSVYFIKSEEYVKIGYSDNVMSRFNTIQTSNPNLLEILLIMPGGTAVESYFHNKFKDHLYRGEWFYLSEEIQHFIDIHKDKFQDFQIVVSSENILDVEESLDDVCLESLPWEFSMNQIPRNSNIERVVLFFVEYYSKYGEEPRNREIVEATDVSKGQVSSIVSKLKASGFA